MTENKFPAHPGTIRMTEEYAKTAREVPIAEVPEARRFVYLKDGKETTNPAEATERVPIVLVRMLSLDERGNLVAKEVATKVVIHEFGPEGRPLRHTTMTRNR